MIAHQLQSASVDTFISEWGLADDGFGRTYASMPKRANARKGRHHSYIRLYPRITYM